MMVNNYSAELIVTSALAEAGWDIYFPHRDKENDGIPIIRPYYKNFFDRNGTKLMEQASWKDCEIDY